MGISALALPASAAFNSYTDTPAASGDVVVGENYFFAQISGSQVRMTWSRASGQSGPSQFSVSIEAYSIPSGKSVPPVNPFSMGTFSTVAQTFEPWVTGSVSFLTGDRTPATMYPDVTSSSQIEGTRFRAVFTSVTESGFPSRSVTVYLDGYGPGDRWQ